MSTKAVVHRVWTGAGEETPRWVLPPRHVALKLAQVQAHRRFGSVHWFEKSALAGRRVRPGEAGTDIDVVGLVVFNEDQLAPPPNPQYDHAPVTLAAQAAALRLKKQPKPAPQTRQAKFLAELGRVVAQRRACSAERNMQQDQHEW